MLLLAIACHPAIAAEVTTAASTEPLTVVLIPARVHVLKAGTIKVQASAEWTEAASGVVDTAVREVVRQSSHFSVREMPSLTPEEDAAIEDFLALATIAPWQSYDAGKKGITRALWRHFDRSLGSSLAFLRNRTGAGYGLISLGAQVEQSDGLVAMNAAGMLASAFLPLFIVPTATRSYGALFLVDLSTGQVRWCNGRSGHEVAGYNFTDLRDPSSVSKVVAALLKPFPEVPEGLEATAEPAVAPSGLLVNPDGLVQQNVMPLVGEFTVRTPAGWRVRTDSRKAEISATRDSRLLNEFKVQLRRHSMAFPESGRKSTRESTPDQLAQWYASELQAQEIDDLQVIEITVGEQLAGRAAFRVRFSYKLPAEWGAARMDGVAVGTAVPRGLLLSQLTAPQLFYFGEALPAFEESTRTIALETRKSTR